MSSQRVRGADVFLVLLNQFHFFWINKNETATPMKVRPAQNTSGTRRLPVGAVPDYAAAIERHGRARPALSQEWG